MKIAVTGNSGFIGSHLVPALLANHHEVTCLVDSEEDLRWGKTACCKADITAPGELENAFRDADAVIHLAARNHVLKDAARDPLGEYRLVNVDGTRNVVHAASECGAKLFLHFSSIKGMGEESADVLNEDSPCNPTTDYGTSKLESEEVVRTDAVRSGMKAVIVRLPMVYGPRNRGNLPRMIRWADRGLPFPLFKPDNLRSIIYVGNVVAGVMELLIKTPEGVSTYILKDREDCSSRRIYSVICRELGKTPRFLPVPAPVVRFAGMLSSDFRKVTGSLRVSAAKIENDIGFVPPFSLEEGISRTVEWYKHSDH